MSDGLPKALERHELATIKDGQTIWVKWSGGNGPHRYTAKVFGGSLYCQTDWERYKGILDPIKAFSNSGTDFVGPWPPWNRVWITDPRETL